MASVYFVKFIQSQLVTKYFRIQEPNGENQKTIAVIGWPTNDPPLLSSMFVSKLWVQREISPKIIRNIDVILYDIDAKIEGENDLELNKLSPETLLVFDWSNNLAQFNIAVEIANGIIESFHLTTNYYLNFVVVGQAASTPRENLREFNSYLPLFVNLKAPFPSEEKTADETDGGSSSLTSIARSRFLCLGGYPAPHKIFFMAELDKHGLLDQMQWTAGTLETGRWGNYHSVLEKRLSEQNDITIDDLDRFTRKLPHVVDIDPGQVMQDSITAINPDLYTSGDLHIVLESEDNSPDISGCKTDIRYTEKTLKAIVMEHPFLIYGNFGTLILLQSHGFRTFHPIINETYDLIPTRKDRVDALLLEITRLSKLDQDDYAEMLVALKKVTVYNQKWLQSKQFKEMLRTQGEFALGLLPDNAFDNYQDMSTVVDKIYAGLNPEEPCSIFF